MKKQLGKTYEWVSSSPEREKNGSGELTQGHTIAANGPRPYRVARFRSAANHGARAATENEGLGEIVSSKFYVLVSHKDWYVFSGRPRAPLITVLRSFLDESILCSD